MAHATKLVPFRVNFIYMISVVFITILVPSSDERLLGGSSVAASPFVVAIEDAGIKGISSLLNAGMMCGVLAIAAEAVYLSSRILRTMAHQKLLPERLAQVDNKGRPRWALLITCIAALIMSYIQLASGGLTVLNWLISITSASFFTNWIIISFTKWRFHAALKAQNDPLFSQVYAWKSTAWPLAPAWLMLISLLLLACCLVCGIDPIGSDSFSAENFFQYMIGFLVIVVFTIGYKVIYRTPWRDPNTADCVTGRRNLSVEEINQLDDYYKMSRWRRFLTSYEAAMEILQSNQWIKGGHWKIANEKLAATPHYHATTHEAYTVLHGTGTYLLGKSPLDADFDEHGNAVGVKFVARPGDVFAWPAGVTHFVTDTQDDYEIIGFYALTGFNTVEEPYDMEYALDSEEETAKKRDMCERVPGPELDPVYGKEGSMPKLWKRTGQ
ncbi:hypothetical protein K4K52_006380 [Colletotrichum sp. SAR 10_76]|nr:hypothetical protein K4K52_006380 [Colletotrichum sp. SAR 10_76]